MGCAALLPTGDEALIDGVVENGVVEPEEVSLVDTWRSSCRS